MGFDITVLAMIHHCEHCGCSKSKEICYTHNPFIDLEKVPQHLLDGFIGHYALSNRAEKSDLLVKLQTMYEFMKPEEHEKLLNAILDTDDGWCFVG